MNYNHWRITVSNSFDCSLIYSFAFFFFFIFQYGQIRHYRFSFVVHAPMGENISTTGKLLVKCLHQLNFAPSNDRLNGQKFVAQLSLIKNRLDEEFINEQNEQIPSEFDVPYDSIPTSTNDLWPPPASNVRSRPKRSGFYQYFEHLWTDIKTILPFEETKVHGGMSKHDSFDEEMLQTLKLDLRKKCSWNSDNTDDGVTELDNDVVDGKEYRIERLPFWFVQLDDGTIPQIGFTKQEKLNRNKNFKKFLILLFERSNTSNISDEMNSAQQNITNYDINSKLFSDVRHEQNDKSSTNVVNRTQTQIFRDNHLLRSGKFSSSSSSFSLFFQVLFCYIFLFC